MNDQQQASTFVERVRFDAKGLVPAIAQDRESGEVLMMAWMNRESLEQTIATGQATYFSRSRHELWVKGATSGNTQRVHSLALDCDGDSLILQVDQSGSACHSGLRSCFRTISLDLA